MNRADVIILLIQNGFRQNVNFTAQGRNVTYEKRTPDGEEVLVRLIGDTQYSAVRVVTDKRRPDQFYLRDLTADSIETPLSGNALVELLSLRGLIESDYRHHVRVTGCTVNLDPRIEVAYRLAVTAPGKIQTIEMVFAERETRETGPDSSGAPVSPLVRREAAVAIRNELGRGSKTAKP